jgi:hypothetical protein
LVIRKDLLAISLLIPSQVVSQDTVTDAPRKMDSLEKAINSSQVYSDSLRQKEDIERMTSRSADYFVQYRKEQRAKQKKQAIIYIVMGVAGLIVLLIGLLRRKKIKIRETISPAENSPQLS